MKKLFSTLMELLQLNLLLGDVGKLGVEVEPPDIVVHTSRGVFLNRFLVCRDLDYSVEDIVGNKDRAVLESYAALLKSLPSDVHIYLFKQEVDMKAMLAKLKNTMLNIQAELELTHEETKRVKLKAKLEKTRALLNALLEGKPFLKMAMVVVYRVQAKDKATAKSVADYYESLLSSVFKNHFGFKLDRASYVEILTYVTSFFGLRTEPGVEGVNVEPSRAAYLYPIALDKPLISETGILLGFEKDTKHPVIISVNDVFYHTAVIGPTGKGKTTLLASVIEQVVSENMLDVIAIDFKGDLKRYVSEGLVSIVTPSEAEISIIKPPSGVEELSWKRVVVDALSHIGGLTPENIVEALLAVERDTSGLFKTPAAAALIPFIEFIKSNVSYEWIGNYLSKNIIVDLEGRGTIFQNVYASLFLGIVRHLLLEKQRNKGVLLIIDDAWRILKLRTLVEIVREGRSRKLGVILSTQSPDDIPSDILENTYNIVVYGSTNENYLSKVKQITGISDSTLVMLSRMKVGEALYFTALSRNAKLIDIHKPVKYSSSSLAS